MIPLAAWMFPFGAGVLGREGKFMYNSSRL